MSHSNTPEPGGYFAFARARAAMHVKDPDPRGYACYELREDGRPVRCTGPYPTIAAAEEARARCDPDEARGWYVDVAR